ncbi:helix-turn-helix transcriptional regulator [Micromonospora sp. NPDC050686]|uniref:helix-turn-helix domain-containing protein n=1 Tax=Micromonospora sp. NPDC050686 TaxID=3154631 RepID=UPI0033F0B181
MPESRLSTMLSTVIRQQRQLRELNQRQLAELAGVSQATVARVERGDRSPSLPALERLLAAMQVQLTVDVEPLDAHLDARLAEHASRPLAEVIDDLGLDRLLDRLGDLPNLLTGATAAVLQGAPVPAEAVEIALRWRDSARFTSWLEAGYAQRWNARWAEWGGVHIEPEEPGEHRWLTKHGEIRAQMCAELPEGIEVRHGGRGYRVVPLVQVELTDPRAADLLRRHRQRQQAG